MVQLNRELKKTKEVLYQEITDQRKNLRDFHFMHITDDIQFLGEHFEVNLRDHFRVNLGDHFKVDGRGQI